MYSYNEFSWPPPYKRQLGVSPATLSSLLPLPTPSLLSPYLAATKTASPALNWPEEYDSHITRNGMDITFAHPIPHIVGNEKYFMLLDPIIFPLNNGNAIQCYISHVSTVGIWRMKKEDIVKLNSIIFDISRMKHLYGEIKYYNLYGSQQHFKIDRFSAFFSSSGRSVSRKSSSITKGMIQDLEAIISLKISGVVQSEYHGTIDGIISIHDFQVVRKPKREHIHLSMNALHEVPEEEEETRAEADEEKFSTAKKKLVTFV